MSDPLAVVLDLHWLAQRVESGVAYCSCGGWEFDARSGQRPLPVLGEKFLPFSEHVASMARAFLVAYIQGEVTDWPNHGPEEGFDEGWDAAKHSCITALGLA